MAKWDPTSMDDAVAAKETLGLSPLDNYNAALLDEVHPREWPEPSAPPVYDLLVIGAGAGGLVSSKQSARRGARSCMISEALAGGDCLNVGCVPSKALLRAARAVREVRRAAEYGVVLSEQPTVDFSAIMCRLRRLRAHISPVDGHTATQATGSDVYQGRGRFTGRHTAEVNGRELRFRKAVIATGGRARVPDIPGIESVPYLTNADLFNLERLPERLVIYGAGAVALEMAQAFATFGSHVTVVSRSASLLKGEPAAAGAALRAALEADGVTFIFGAEATRAQSAVPPAAAAGNGERGGEGGAGATPTIALTLAVRSDVPGGSEADDAPPAASRRVEVSCDALLLASGRVPNVEDLGLEAAGIEYTAEGVRVDELLRTSNPDVYAVGDCVGGTPRLTHMAGEMAKLAVQNSLFGGQWRLSSLVVPRCIYTEPELASVGEVIPTGKAAGDAAAAGEDEVVEYTASLRGNDRAILEGEADDGGFVLVRAWRGSGKIVGASVVANRAGEIINELSLAIKAGLTLEDLGRNIHPYPTTGEAVMGCGLQWINARWKTLR